MVRLLLISFLLFFPFFLSAQDEEGELVNDFYFNADSNNSLRDGSDQYPYKYLSEFTMPPSGVVKLYFYAAENSYQYDYKNSDSIIFRLPKRTGPGSVKIEKIGSGTVKFNGTYMGGNYKSGIDIECSNVTIEDGINLTNFRHNPIYIHGSDSNPLSNITIKNCIIDSTLETDGDTARNCAAIRSAFADIVQISNCEITQRNQSAQVDGIFAAKTSNLTITNNRIILEHNTDTLQHLDCIQITNDCRDVTIENNYIENASTQINRYRQGVYVTETSGIIRVLNNVIVSGRGRSLINISIDDSVDSLHILNNTLSGKGNPEHLAAVVNSGIVSYSPIKIMNNIFYKEVNIETASSVLLHFNGFSESNFTNSILNYNLYRRKNTSNSSDTSKPRIQFNTVQRTWDYDPLHYEADGIGADPMFEQSTEYTLSYESPAKNRGAGLYNLDVTKDKSGNPRPYWNYDYDIGAFEIEDTQFKIGITGVLPNTEVIHSVQVFDTYWERNSSGSWSKSTDQELASASFTTEGNVTDIDSLKGFQYKWIDRYPYVNSTRIGTGLYKVTNNYNNNSDYIYVDLRDAVQDYSLNVYIQYDALNGKYNYRQNGVWKELPNGSVIGIWELPVGSVTTHTGQLDAQFWRYCLVDLEKDNHPFLVWAPYTQSGTTSYTLYRKNGASFAAVTPGYTWRHYDSTLYIVQPGGQAGHTVSYYVSAQSSNTDTVNYDITGKNPEKITGSYSPHFVYNLSQNYPNPFNPSTSIEFSVAEKGLVTLKLYDILGREVSTLLNKELDPGIHKHTYNLDYLASGIYIYRITTGRFIDNKKLQILK